MRYYLPMDTISARHRVRLRSSALRLTRALIAGVAAGLLALSATMSPAQDAKPPTPDDVYDGFEGAELSPVWDTSKFDPGAVTVQSDVVRVGQRAARIVLRPGPLLRARHEW